MNKRKAEFIKSIEPMTNEELKAICISKFDECENNEAALKETTASLTEMHKLYVKLVEENKSLKKENKDLKKMLSHVKGINILNQKALFGNSSEKIEMLGKGGDFTDPLDEDAEEHDEKSSVEADETCNGDDNGNGNGNDGGDKKDNNCCRKGRKTGSKNKKSKKDFIDGLPKKIEFDFDPDKLDEMYDDWYIVSMEKHVTLESIPASGYARIVYRPVICHGPNHSIITRPELAPYTIFPKSMASPSILSDMLIHKFDLGTPYYSLERYYARKGLPLQRQTMNNWTIQASEKYLYPVFEYLSNQLANYEYQQADETTFTVIKDGRSAGSTSYVWVHTSSELCKDMPAIILYFYEKTRSAEHLRLFFANTIRQIILACDAFSGYQSLAKGNDLIILAICNSHSRRRFVLAYEILNKCGLSDETIERTPEFKIIKMMGEIYHLDTQSKKESPTKRDEIRKEIIAPKYDALMEYIKNIDLEDPSLSDKMKEAINYAKNNEKGLRVFLTDPHVPIDNSFAERCVKRVLKYRNNSMFCYSIEGAVATTTIMSLIETAKANNADPYYYLMYLLEELPKCEMMCATPNMPDLTPWSEAYKAYEKAQKDKIPDFSKLYPPGTDIQSVEKPRLRCKRKKAG